MIFQARLGLLLCALRLVSAASSQPERPATAVLASTLVGRGFDLANFLKSYDKAVTNLTTYVIAFSSDPSSKRDFEYAAGYLAGSTSGGTDSIKKAGAVTVTEESGAIAMTLETDVDALRSSLKAKKSTFESAGYCAMVQSVTTDLVSYTEDLTSALLANVASEYLDAVRPVASAINDSYSKAKSDFAGGNCLVPPRSTSTSASVTSATGGSGNVQPSRSSQAGSGTGTSRSSQPQHTGDPPSQAPASASQNHLSVAAKAAIGVGASLGALILIAGAAGICFYRRQRRLPGQVAHQTQKFPNTIVAPSCPELVDTGKTELGIVQIQTAAGLQDTCSPTSRLDLARGPCTPAGPFELGPGVPSVSERDAKPHDAHYGQQQQQQQQLSKLQNERAQQESGGPKVLPAGFSSSGSRYEPPSETSAAEAGRNEQSMKPSSGEEALVQSRELLRKARQRLNDFITARSKPHDLPKERPTYIQLASMLHGQSDIEAKAKFIENAAPPLMIEALITQYHHHVTPAHLRPLYASCQPLYADASGEMSFHPWWGKPRLYERDDPSGQSSVKETPGYRWRYDHGENQAGPSVFIQMTVSVKGDVQLSTGSTSYFLATPEGFTALLQEWDHECGK